MIFVPLNLLRYVLWPEYVLSWLMFHMNLRIMCIVLLLDEVQYRCTLYPVDQWWC